VTRKAKTRTGPRTEILSLGNKDNQRTSQGQHHCLTLVLDTRVKIYCKQRLDVDCNFADSKYFCDTIYNVFTCQKTTVLISALQFDEECGARKIRQSQTLDSTPARCCRLVSHFERHRTCDTCTVRKYAVLLSLALRCPRGQILSPWPWP